MAAAEGRSYFCPFQQNLENVKVLWVDIRGGGKYFRKNLKFLKEREKKISPFEVEVGGFRVHVTPLENTKHERSSFHILRLFDSKDSLYRVDLLIQDTDLYFVGFRRKANGVWGQWFTFKDTDKKVDTFLGATHKIDLSMRYPEDRFRVTPGCSQTALRDIFKELIRFQTLRRVTKEFKHAVYSVMVIFCEVRRLKSLSEEISRRFDQQLPPQELTECQYEKIHQWGSASGIVLEANKDKVLALGTPLPEWWDKNLELKYISCLIGAEGELLILKFNKRYVRENEDFEKLFNDPRSALVPDRDFILPQ